MNNPDQETVLRTIEDARHILGEYIEAGQSDAARTMERLIAVLDKNDVVHALDRMYRRRCCGWSPTVIARKAAFPDSQSSSIGPKNARLGSKAGQNREGPGTSGTARSPSDISSLISGRGLGRLNLFIHWACRQLQYRGPLSNCEIGDQNDCTI